MRRFANQLVSRWLLEANDDTEELEYIQSLTAYLADKLYEDYEPCQVERFADRLDSWLANVEDDDDRKTLYLLLKQIFFVGRREFESLCRAAFHGPIMRWLLDTANVALDDPDISAKYKAAMEETWFCPITDSMRINAFFKVVGVNGRELQPDWRSLRKFGDTAKIRDYIETSGIRRIVLLEDFVGTGMQMGKAITFAAELGEQIQVLVCPLIICPEGVKKALELKKKHKNVYFAQVMSLPPSMFIKMAAERPEPPTHTAVRELIRKTAPRLSPKVVPQTPFGFMDSGATVVLYSNCPDNSLPIIHETADTWRPLFPRIRRG
ncbi:phosphoribosyltransferase-like protein [Bradyrhizobium sp. USDA 3364]